jgi:hypothetical protein
LLFQDFIFQALDKQFDDCLVGEGLDPDTMTQEEKDSKKNEFTQALYPAGYTGAIAFPDGMVCNKHTMLSWYLRRRGTNETPDLHASSWEKFC